MDFDSAAPTITVSKVSATKLRRPGSYAIKLAFSAVDDVAANAVTYEIRAFRSGVFQLTAKRGQTTTGAVSVTLRLRSTEPMRTIRFEIDASDPLGNISTSKRTLKLPR